MTPRRSTRRVPSSAPEAGVAVRRATRRAHARPRKLGAARRRIAAGLLALFACLASGCGSEQSARELYLDGDFTGSFKSFSRLADTGDAAAKNVVGIHYYLGLGVEKDLAAAARWFESAALARDARGQRNLGVMYLRGWGVPKDNLLAYGWLYESLRQGNESAREYLRMASDYITPNQSIAAREAVNKRLNEAGASNR